MNGKNISSMNYGKRYSIREFGESVFTKLLNEDNGHGYFFDSDGWCFDFEEFPDLYEEYEMDGWISKQQCYGFKGVIWFDKL